MVFVPKTHKHTRPRVRPRFFDQVGHETMYAPSGNKHFFTKSCHRQTYQNYEQPPLSLENIGLGDQFLLKNVFENFYF